MHFGGVTRSGHGLVRRLQEVSIEGGHGRRMASQIADPGIAKGVNPEVQDKEKEAECPEDSFDCLSATASELLKWPSVAGQVRLVSHRRVLRPAGSQRAERIASPRATSRRPPGPPSGPSAVAWRRP